MKLVFVCPSVRWSVGWSIHLSIHASVQSFFGIGSLDFVVRNPNEVVCDRARFFEKIK